MNSSISSSRAIESQTTWNLWSYNGSNIFNELFASFVNQSMIDIKILEQFFYLKIYD